MNASTNSTDLTARVQNLLEQRQQHADALARIDAALGQIRSAVQGLGGGSSTGRRPGRPPAQAPSPTMSVAAAAPRRGRRGRRGSFATTAEESVMSFIQRERSPTTKEITTHWRSEGRGGKADNLLSRLVKEKTLRRQPIPGERGSRYVLA